MADVYSGNENLGTKMILSKIHAGPVLDFFTPDLTTPLEMPLAGAAIAASQSPPLLKSDNTPLLLPGAPAD